TSVCTRSCGRSTTTAARRPRNMACPGTTCTARTSPASARSPTRCSTRASSETSDRAEPGDDAGEEFEHDPLLSNLLVGVERAMPRRVEVHVVGFAQLLQPVRVRERLPERAP